MKRMQKGMTLVEVLVSISVFTIITFSLFSAITGIRKVVARQEEYVRIEMLCRDLAFQLQAEGQDLLNKNENGEPQPYSNFYYDSNFKKTDDESQKKYTLSYEYSYEDKRLVIKSISDGSRTFVENIDCNKLFEQMKPRGNSQ